MATLLLQVAGQALGSALGGPIGGILGAALGGIAGAAIDQSLLGQGGVKRVEGPRLKEIGGLASTEGAPIPRLYGRARLGGQLIWATRFEEEIRLDVTRSKSGGKGGGSPKTVETSYAYFANLAIGLCEGPISFVRRVWVDGRELDRSTVTLRVHRGLPDQEPDPLIVAKEAGEAPAYRDLAYVVFERLPLADYGNRVPQFAFEVVRAVDGLSGMIRAVTLIPGAGEFVYDARPISHEPEPGVTRSLSRNQLFGGADIDASLSQLRALCPNLRKVALVVSWFGDDLRAGSCSLAPRVEAAVKPTDGAQWAAAGLTRATARVVSEIDGKPAFGGTPSDESVVALIRKLRLDYGLAVVLYPFIMMDIPAGNALPDPVSGAPGQPRYPWRGRITASGDVTAQVAAFLGSVGPGDMAVAGGSVTCAKPQEWSLRRLVLHYAALAQAAGGVDGFIIGSELVGLTHLRRGEGYPMVDGLVALAQDVRVLLPEARLTYAADWTEYGADVRSGGQDVGFPLDPLWASPAIDAIGVDYYPPLSDWRDSGDHADATIARGASELDYLRDRLTAGEAYDWYYADAAGRAAQSRLPIADGAFGKPWVFRPKDLAGWWLNRHVERRGGVETRATAFQPGSKPIWLTETGIPAVDKGGNAPNVFPDPHASAAGYPFFSSGARDDLVQARGLEAIISGFDPARSGFSAQRNPVHPGSGLRMIDPASIFVWTFDARPFPAFPDLGGIWADGANYETGHWINGRIEGAPLERLVSAILANFGLPPADELSIDGFADGYVLDRPLSARAALEPLATIFGFDATMSGGRLCFRGRGGRIARALSPDDWLLDRDAAPFEMRRAQETELPHELRLGFSDAQQDYRSAAAQSRRLAGAARRESALETALVIRQGEAQRLADQRLQEIWASRETLDIELSPRCIDLEPGDVVSLPVGGQRRLFRLTRLVDGLARRVSARAVEPAIYAPAASRSVAPPPRTPPALPGRPYVIPLDWPIARSANPPLLSVAAFASPWPGALAVWQADASGHFALLRTIEPPSIVGETLTELPPGPIWRSDRRAQLEIRLRGGILASVSPEAALAGANALALLDAQGVVEIVTAADVELIGPQRFRLSGLVRGLGGSESAAARKLPAGSRLVVLDGAAATLTDTLSDIGQARRYRIGPIQRDPGDLTMTELNLTATGAALRPLAPVHPRASRSEAGVEIAWIRRARLDGDSWELDQPPLGEEAERYALTLYRGTSIVSAVECPAPVWTYPRAQELADFGALQSELALGIAQLSRVVGRGHEWRGRIAIA
ncbi:MAG: glycoside hydrolase/phage tail family protein [Bosea sp. (in: a-proteobacteria)]